MNRRDDINQLYEQSNRVQIMAQIFFWINIFVGIVSPFIPQSELLIKIADIVQGVSALLFLILTLIDECYCWYEAEAERRKNDIENAFGITMGELITEEYYNNTLPSSMGKFAVNALESSFFSKTIATKMLPKVIIKALFAIIVMMISSFIVSDPSTLLLIVQAALTISYIEDAIKLIRYSTLVKSTYSTLFSAFITVGVESRKQELNAFTTALEYEAIKAHFKIRLDSRIFMKINTELSVKWTEIHSKIRYEIDRNPSN